MNPENNQNNYSYSPPQQNNVQPQTVVYREKKGSSWWKYLLGCGFIFLIFACICVVPIITLATFSSSLNSSITTDPSSNIEQKTLFTTGDKSSSKTTNLALINVTGEITYSMPGDSTMMYGATSQNLIAQLKKADQDKSVEAVMLRLNTPGGEVSAAEPICHQLKTMTKPVYTFIDSMGASLGYLLPNCTKYIYARPSSVTGSIGVILQAVDYYGVLENFGGKVVFVTNSAGTQKSGRDVFDTNSATYKNYQSILDETYDYFLTVVAEGRSLNHPDLTKEKLKQYADGRIFSGNQAENVGLVDELGEFEKVIDSIIEKEPRLKGTEVNVVEYSVYSSPFSSLFQGAKSIGSSLDVKENIKKDSGVKLLMQSGIVDFEKPQSRSTE